MHANSRPITSSQAGIHDQLVSVVSMHTATVFQKPIASYNQAAFDASAAAWRNIGRPPLILDSGCGVGLSTLHLAREFPDHFVIGVDQSADRLARNTHWGGPSPENAMLVRADLVDYWRLMQAAGMFPARHYLLYPNPWPKIGHLKRRWHGHPVFPAIAALGGIVECRSNWRIYVEEWAAALNHVTGSEAKAEPYSTAVPITPFERKYLASGHTLWRCRAVLA